MPGHSIILQLGGLEELQNALRKLPPELVREAIEIIDDTVEVTAAQLFQAYPIGPPQRRTAHQAAHVPGALRRGIRRTIEGSPFGAVGIVKSTAPHAHLWEFGTQSRAIKNAWRQGAPTGAMKPQFNKGLVGISIRNRRRMNQKLVELVQKAGFEVSGSF